MTIYLDGDFIAHINPADGLEPWSDENNDLAGIDMNQIEKMRIVPNGKTWTRDDGHVFTGPMISAAISENGQSANVGLVQALQNANAVIAALDQMVVDLEYQNALLTIEQA